MPVTSPDFRVRAEQIVAKVNGRLGACHTSPRRGERELRFEISHPSVRVVGPVLLVSRARQTWLDLVTWSWRLLRSARAVRNSPSQHKQAAPILRSPP